MKPGLLAGLGIGVLSRGKLILFQSLSFAAHVIVRDHPGTMIPYRRRVPEPSSHGNHPSITEGYTEPTQRWRALASIPVRPAAGWQPAVAAFPQKAGSGADWDVVGDPRPPFDQARSLPGLARRAISDSRRLHRRARWNRRAIILHFELRFQKQRGIGNPAAHPSLAFQILQRRCIEAVFGGVLSINPQANPEPAPCATAAPVQDITIILMGRLVVNPVGVVGYGSMLDGHTPVPIQDIRRSGAANQGPRQKGSRKTRIAARLRETGNSDWDPHFPPPSGCSHGHLAEHAHCSQQDRSLRRRRSELRDDLRPDGDHSDKQHHGCEGGCFLHEHLEHGTLPLQEHMKNIVPFLF
jgi:hypothetical protein